MKQKMVTTNLRVPEVEWVNARVMAAARGLSLNEYMGGLLRQDAMTGMTGIKSPKVPKSVSRAYDALWKLANQKTKGKPMGASEDDKVIYGIED